MPARRPGPPRFTDLLFSPRAQPVWQFALLAQLLLVCFLAFDPMPRGPSVGHLDKLQHLLAFVALSFAAHWAWPERASLGAARRSLAWPGAAMLGFGLFIEAVQAFIPARSASLGDVLADAMGIALGLLSAVVIALWLARRSADTPPRSPGTGGARPH